MAFTKQWKLCRKYNSMKFLDLFSGIGGFHSAANIVFGDNAECVGFSEIDETCIKVYKNAYDKSVGLVNGDVRNLAASSKEGWEVKKFDICFGGFPCQPYSNVGKRNGLDDERSWVFYDLLRVLREYQPKYFVLENVEKIRTLNKGAVLEKLVRHLESVGYQVDVFDLCASDYGLPQQRKRLFFSGRLRKAKKAYKPLSRPGAVDLNDCLYPTVWHLLERDMPDAHIVPLGSRKTIFTKNDKWMGTLEIDRDIARPLCASMGKWHRANQDNYYSEKYVMTKNGQALAGFDYLRDKVRRVTPTEALRLQGFREPFVADFMSLGIKSTPAFKAIGNAVPVNMAVAVLENLLAGD